MDENLKKQLKIFACKARIGAIDGIYCAKAGHPGGSLSICDLLSYLYNVEMNVDPKNPQDPKRDRLVLSKGHAAPALYATLALKGYFPVEDLKTLRKSDSYLQGHPNMNKVPGVDMSTGSLGQGISCAVGMALGGKTKRITEYTQFSATEKLKKVRFGKQLCLPATTILIISPHLLITTDFRLTVPLMKLTRLIR